MSNRRTLLAGDGAINVLLGVALISFPERLVVMLGVPGVASAFYPSVLGGVLVGVGVALFIERSRPPAGLAGLGLAGAVVINLCAGLVLSGWLLFGDLALPVRGRVFLWGLVALLVGLSGLEVAGQLGGDRDDESRSPEPGEGTRR